MKLGEAIPNYQAYRNELQDKKTSIYKQYKKTKEKAERTNDEEWIQKAAELELSYKEATDDFDKYENVLNSLREQWCAAANTENDKALADPETGLGATIGKIMTTIAECVQVTKFLIQMKRRLWNMTIKCMQEPSRHR